MTPLQKVNFGVDSLCPFQLTPKIATLVWILEQKIRFHNQGICKWFWRCSKEVESILHLYSGCDFVHYAWNCLRELLESLDQLILFESDHSFLNLYFSCLLMEDQILWLIGEYVLYIDQEVILNNRRVVREDLMGYLESRRQTCNFMRISRIGFIPGMNLLKLSSFIFSLHMLRSVLGDYLVFFKSGLEGDGNLNKQTFNYIQKLNTYFFMNNLKLFSTLFSAIEFLYNIGVLTVTKVNLP